MLVGGFWGFFMVWGLCLFSSLLEKVVYLSAIGVSVSKDIKPYLPIANKVVKKEQEKLHKASNILSISDRISELRYRLKLSKDALGEIAGISGTSVNNIENGKTKNPGADVLQAIASKLGISTQWLLLGEGEMLTSDASPQKTSSYTAPFDVHAVGFLGDFPVVELPFVSFKARASFVDLGGADVSAGNFERVMHRCGIDEHGNQRTPADYADAIVFEVDGDSMTPSMQSGQKVIAWPIPEGKWEHLHNTACVVAYDDTVTVKAILENDLFVNNRLTLRATKPGGHSIWEVREFFGVVPYRLFQ
jgi:transcriptional regulator with XRE-family HTH domain